MWCSSQWRVVHCGLARSQQHADNSHYHGLEQSSVGEQRRPVSYGDYGQLVSIQDQTVDTHPTKQCAVLGERQSENKWVEFILHPGQISQHLSYIRDSTELELFF